MQVGDVMTRRVYTATRETMIGELAQLLASRNISGAPVTGPSARRDLPILSGPFWSTPPSP